MAQLRDIKNSIDSVKKTQKLTQAMKMVAAAKFKRSTQAALQTRSYLNALDEILTNLSVRLEPDYTPRLMEENNAKKEVAVIIAGDKGLCGGFNANILKFTHSFLKSHKEDISLVLFGNKSQQFFKNKQWKIDQFHSNFMKDISIYKVVNTLSSLIEKYKAGEISKIWLFYNEFASAVSTKLVKKQLVPAAFEAKQNDDKSKMLSDYFYQPSKEETIENLLEDFVNYFTYKAFLESQAAEEGARMAAMDSATDNAGDMIKSLTLLFNRKRQAQITAELSEIVAGANALVN